MSSYFLLAHLHLTLVVISGVGFALRGFFRLVLERPLLNPMVKVGPHLVDTLLLISGIALWIMVPYALWSWLGVKLAMVLLYITLGLIAFRTENRNAAVIAYLSALVTFLAIVATAMVKPF